MGVRLGSIVQSTAMAVGNLIPFSTGALTRLMRSDTFADWVAKTYPAFTGIGGATDTLQNRLLEVVSVKQFTGVVGNGINDDTVGVQAALTWALQNNARLWFPRGIYLITTGLTLNGVTGTNFGKLVVLEGEGSQVDGNIPAVIFKWGGTSNLANTLFKANGVGKLICKGIAFYGAGKVGKVFHATQNVGVSWSPFGWQFQDCTFEAALATGSGFYIDTNTNMARFGFVGCNFQAGANCEGFTSVNQNSLNHSFFNCTFGPNIYGIHINGGSFNAIGCEFALNSGADVYLQIHSPITMIDCWSEQSRQFIISDFRTQYSPLTLIGCTTSSFPWSYWKSGLGAQPVNDFSQWIAILWDGDRGSLNMMGCTLVDPFNGAITGAVAPTVASTLLVSATNGTNTGEPRFNFVGSLSQNGTDSFTEQFFNYGNTQLAAPRIAPRKKIQDYGNFAGGFTINTHLDSTAKWTMTGNNTVTMSTAQAAAGNRYGIDVTQDGVGGRTMTFVNAKTAGVFTPTAAAGARSRIEFEFDGTNWIEVARSLNLA